MAWTQDVLDDLADWYSVPASSAAAAQAASAPRWSIARPARSLRSAVHDDLVRIVEAFLTWHDRARDRRALMELSDHMLRDIGISRAAAHGEAAKPFWRA